MAAMLLALFVSGLDASVVNVMLPKLETVFSVSMEKATLLAAVYVSLMAAFGLPLGRCSDLFSPVRIFSFGVLLFGAGSLLCGLSTVFVSILVGRAIQGMGAAMLASSFGAVILGTIPKEKTGSAVGSAMTVMSIGSLVGPPLGGYFASSLSWHWAFMINVPLCILSLVLLLPSLLEKKSVQKKELSWSKFDPAGAFWGALVMLALPAALHLVSTDGWKSPRVLVLFTLSMLGWVAFVRTEKKAEYPLLPPEIFSAFRVKALAWLKVLLFVALNGVMLVYPFFINSRPNLDVGDAGWLMLACAVAMTLLTPVGGKLCDRFNPDRVMLLGTALLTLVALVSMEITKQPDRAVLAISLAGFGAAISLTLVSSTVSFLKLAPPEHAGVFSALNSLLAPLGGAVGMSVFPLIYSGPGFTASLAGVMVSGVLMLSTVVVLKFKSV